MNSYQKNKTRKEGGGTKGGKGEGEGGLIEIDQNLALSVGLILEEGQKQWYVVAT